MFAFFTAAQIVSGIGFLGAGVIFKGRDVVRGLTTAATIRVSAAVGGAGMVSLGVVLTIFHLITLFIIAPAVRRIPSVDRNRVMHIEYADGHGVLRQIDGIDGGAVFRTPSAAQPCPPAHGLARRRKRNRTGNRLKRGRRR